MRQFGLLFLMAMMCCVGVTSAEPSSIPKGTFAEARPKRLLLLGQKPDSHPKATHEYMRACQIVARLLQDRGNLQVVVVQADSPWTEGPQLLDGADGVFLFLSQGAKWINADSERLSAFKRLADRGGGLACLHWAMGTKDAEDIPNFIELFGGCHGGPDRKYKYGDFRIAPTPVKHEITSGVTPIEVHDEFYYDLKFPTSKEGQTFLVQARIEEKDFPVAWAWERKNSGRSFGFSGLHFHENWKRIEYRRIVIQGILWTLHESIPATGLALEVTDSDLALPEDGSPR